MVIDYLIAVKIQLIQENDINDKNIELWCNVNLI